MKKLRVLSLVLALAILFAVPAGVFAAEAAEIETLPDAGTLPDSPFYFMDQWGKSLSLMFTFSAEAKVQKALGYADERIAEIDAMLAQNKIEQAARAANGYQNYLEATNKYMEQVRVKGGDVSEEVTLIAVKHLGYFCDNTENATEEARNLMTKTIERALVSQETALKNMAQIDPEKAIRINLQSMESHLNRLRVQTEAGESEAARARLEVYNRLGNLGDEISQIARGSGKETAVNQMLGMATANHLEILAQVQQHVRGEAQEAVQSTIMNCIQNHEQLVTRLQEQDQLGPVPEETPIPNMLQNMFQNRIEQSTQTQTQTGNQTQTSVQAQTNQATQGTAGQDSTLTQVSTQTRTGQGSQSITESCTGSNTGGQGGSSGSVQQGGK